MLETRYNSIAFLDDIIRHDFWESKEFVYGLINEPIRQGTGLPITGSARLHSNDWIELGFDKEVFLSIIKSLEKNWIDCYNRIPDAAADLLIKALRTSTVYIGYEMPLWLTNILTSNHFTYIDVRLSPIRFCRDLYFAVNSNSEYIKQRLSSFEVPYDFLRIEATQIKASIAHLRGGASTPQYEDSLIFIGQTSTDTSLISSDNGDILRPSRFSDQIRTARKKYKKIYYLPHPYGFERADDEIRELESILEENIEKCDISSYEILCKENRIGLIAISSGFLQEAKCFDKDTYYLYKPVCFIEGIERHINIEFDDISDPYFWSTLLPTLNATVTSHKSLRRTPPNQLRLLHDAWWGYNELMLKDRNHYRDIVTFGGAASSGDLNKLQQQTHQELEFLRSDSAENARTIAAIQRKNDEVMEKIRRMEIDLHLVAEKYRATQKNIISQNALINDLYNSTSWRVTRPLRKFRRFISRISRKLH